MYLKELERIKCPNQYLSFDITKINPLDWLKSKNENNYSKIAFEVDGYIIDKFKKTNGNFTRIEVLSKEKEIFNSPDLFEEIKSIYKNKIFLNNLFAELLEINHWVLVTLNNYPFQYSHEVKGIMLLEYKNFDHELKLTSKKFLNVKELEDLIRTLRKMSFNKVKNLKSAPSYLSCYLNNNTNNPFPGDCDCVIINPSSKEILSLVEFKTHNIDSPIQNEYIGKYGKQDWRRFNVLYSLQKNIESKQGFRPKLFYVAWGTKEIENHKFIKIDQIDNNKIINTEFFNKPVYGEFNKDLLEKLS